MSSIYDLYYSHENEINLQNIIKGLYTQKNLDVDTQIITDLINQNKDKIFLNTKENKLEDINREMITVVVNKYNSQFKSQKEKSVIHTCNKQKYVESYLYNFNFTSDISTFSLDKLIVPFQSNILFINTNIMLKINEYLMNMMITKEFTIGNRKHYEFVPINKTQIKIDKSHIEFKFFNVRGQYYEKPDIYSIDKYENNKIYLENTNFVIGDIIETYNKTDDTMIPSNSYMIKYIDEKYIELDIDEISECSHFMNLSEQITIYFS